MEREGYEKFEKQFLQKWDRKMDREIMSFTAASAEKKTKCLQNMAMNSVTAHEKEFLSKGEIKLKGEREGVRGRKV